jgi:hypothetical protein
LKGKKIGSRFRKFSARKKSFREMITFWKGGDEGPRHRGMGREKFVDPGLFTFDNKIKVKTVGKNGPTTR